MLFSAHVSGDADKCCPACLVYFFSTESQPVCPSGEFGHPWRPYSQVWRLGREMLLPHPLLKYPCPPPPPRCTVVFPRAVAAGSDSDDGGPTAHLSEKEVVRCTL